LRNSFNKIIFTLKKQSTLNKTEKESEEIIINLRLKLKAKEKELRSIHKTNKERISKLTHNLKNPVGIIYSFSEIILEDIESYCPEKLEKHIKIINSSSAFSLQLLTSISKYSQLQLPETAFTFKKLNYIELLNSIVKQFKPLSIKNDIAIKINAPKNKIFLLLDKKEITQALTNIISNAFCYSFKNTTITITVIENATTIETVVTDEGIGISEENLPHILNEFYVVNTYAINEQKCIGLGLTIANKIIQLHKGKILVTSTIGVGSSFKITIPKKQ